MRKYQPIWERVKLERCCTIEVHPLMVARVKKAVIKEKNQDLGFKVTNDHDYFYLVITSKQLDSNRSKMKFEIKQRLGLEGINHG